MNLAGATSEVRFALAIFLPLLTAFGWQPEPAHAEELSLHEALIAAVGGDGGTPSPAEVDSCSGCCSSHGGITSSCAGNGHVICHDGTVSPSCLCSSCGTSPPPPPTCSGGTYWNGYACVCPSGEVLVGGVCTVPVPTCTGGTYWNGSACVCPSGQELVSGQCQTVAPLELGGGISGSWYDPSQSGHGFLIEVIKNTHQAQAIWFAFDDFGNQAWISGIGPIDGNRIVMPAYLTVGGRFPPHFNAANIERRPWGTLIFTFTDCDHGTVAWSTSDVAFSASGTMNLQRLTQIEGTSCP